MIVMVELLNYRHKSHLCSRIVSGSPTIRSQRMFHRCVVEKASEIGQAAHR
jgi:hypothetical protein